MYYLGYAEGEEWDRVALSHNDLARATDLFVELAQLEACGTYLCDEEGVRLAYYSGYGDSLDIAPPPGTFEFYGPHPDYRADWQEAEAYRHEREWLQAQYYQL